jgi:hypothetical protein
MAVIRAALLLTLTACFPKADPGDFSLCEVGANACPSATFCSDRGLCEPIPVVLRTGVTVSGQVTEGLAGGGQTPLPNAFIAVEGAGLWVLADSSGNYTLRNVPPGSYRMTVHPGAGAQEPIDRPSLGQLPLELDPLDVGRTVVRDLAVRLRGDVIGRVVLRDRNRFDRLHGGVQITVAGLPGHAELSDPDGRFLLAGLPEGEHRLHVQLNGYGAQVHELTVTGLQRQVLPTLNPNPNDTAWVDSAVNMHPSETSPGWTLEGTLVLQEGQTSQGLELLLVPIFTGEIVALEVSAEGAFRAELASGGVYNLFARGPGWRSGRLSQIRGEPGQTVPVSVTPLRTSGGSTADLDEDGIPDDDDDDRDGDGCANAADAFPDDPLGCTDTDGDGIPDPADNDDDNDSIDDLEETRLGSDGLATDPRVANALSGDGIQAMSPSQGSPDGSIQLVDPGSGVSIEPAAVQRPLYGDARTAQLLLQAQELRMPAGSGTQVAVAVAGLPPTSGSEFALFATQQPCPDGLCSSQIEVLGCQTDGWRGETRCSGSATFEAAGEDQVWRLWIRPTLRTNAPSPTTLLGSQSAPVEYDCIGVDAAYPVYGLIHRRVALSRGDFVIRSGGRELALPYLPACFTGENRFQDTCVPWHMRDDDGDDLVMTSFSLSPVEVAFNSCYVIQGADTGNPLVFFRGQAILCSPMTLRATFSDGLGGAEIPFEMVLNPVGTSASFGTFGECWR